MGIFGNLFDFNRDGNVDSWESGKHYIYDITFSATEILIAPSVQNWEEVNNIPAIPAK